ncbi:unnamed protein product [Clavelina lepadiformis]|uniref:Uncharacterized protein n=1 Tax=Clavelina lepadiformis TaxID=159417 RepID=A0ABP0GDJ4_CLALP
MTLVSCDWKQLVSEGDLPCARLGHSIELVGEILYLFGGSRLLENGKCVEFYNDLYEVSVSNSRFLWKKLSSTTRLPPSRDSHRTCFFDKCLYLFGGKNEFVSDKCLSGVYRFDLTSFCWSDLKTCGPSPTAVGFSLSLVSKKAFVFGGITDGAATNDLFVFSLDSNEWLPIKCGGYPPSPRCDHTCEVIDEIIYLFGGAGSDNHFYNDLHCLNTATLTWYQATPRGLPPFARAGHTFVAHRDKDIYIFGGYNHKSNDTTLGLYKMSIGNQKWKRPLMAGCAPDGTHGHCAFILHSTMYIVGGIGPQGELGMESIYALRLINPSLRKPVLEHLLNDLCKEKNSLLCWMETKKPNVSYDINRHDHELDGCVSKLINNSLLCELDNENPATFEVQQSLLRAAQAELASARQSFENDRADIVRILENERSEVTSLIRRHQKQNEDWWNSRIGENDMERDKLRKAWEDVEKERKILLEEREELENKAKKVALLFHQVGDI